MTWRGHTRRCTSLSDKRTERVTGDAESTDGESEWHSENEEEDKLARDMESKVVIAEKEVEAAEEPAPEGFGVLSPSTGKWVC